ncbi:MAG: hypothetical protein WCP68_08165 [Enhydrobacter sp.]
MGFWQLVFGIAIGVAATLAYEASSLAPDIQTSCSSGPLAYSCRFFNRGSGTGAVCVEVQLDRYKPAETYVVKSAVGAYHSQRLCSGPLSKGQDTERNGAGYYGSDGNRVDATELCQLKSSNNMLAGCNLVVSTVAKTTD